MTTTTRTPLSPERRLVEDGLREAVDRLDPYVAAAPAVAQLLAGELGWDEAETSRQVDEYGRLVERELDEARVTSA